MSYSLTAVKRNEKGAKIRSNDVIPAVVYGEGKPAESLTLEYAPFYQLYKTAGEASLIDLLIDGKDSGKVLIHNIQFEPVKNRIMHVDLRKINMNKPITATVELRFVGEPPVIKSMGGTLVTQISSVVVECLPKDLVPSLEVDLSVITSFDVTIKTSQLPLPAGVKIIDPQEDSLIAKAAPALSEEELKAMEESSKEPVDLTKIESAGKKKEDADEEGAEAPAAEKKAEEKK